MEDGGCEHDGCASISTAPGDGDGSQGGPPSAAPATEMAPASIFDCPSDADSPGAREYHLRLPRWRRRQATAGREDRLRLWKTAAVNTTAALLFYRPGDGDGSQGGPPSAAPAIAFGCPGDVDSPGTREDHLRLPLVVARVGREDRVRRRPRRRRQSDPAFG